MNGVAEGASRGLLVFAKAPVPGRVKTRLVGQLGRRGAARAYRQLLEATLEAASAVPATDLTLWCSPHRHPTLSCLARAAGAKTRVQPPGDLGRRMRGALSDALRVHDTAVLVGGDCATLTPAMIEQAFVALESGAEWVFAPAEDGGYTLVGTRRAEIGPFRSVPWGGGNVMRVTVRRLRGMGVSWRRLPTTWDIDRPADWRRWRRIGRVGRGQYP